MKAKIEKGILIIDPETVGECYQLNEWWDSNPVSERDGIEMELNCIRE